MITMAGDDSSFRDPSGHVFTKNGRIFRRINSIYFPQFTRFADSGLYASLTGQNLLIPHDIVSRTGKSIIIRPRPVPFISYPYEWSFDMLKSAALLTLRIQQISLDFGMVLRDASVFNVQFIGTRPVFIDTLSFDLYREGDPWIAYQQFCRHFLAPLALMSRKDLRLNMLLREYIDGIPLDLASRLLPPSSKFSFSLLSHIHLHSANQKRMADKKVETGRYRMSRLQMDSLIRHLHTTVGSFGIGKITTQWEKYYSFTNYSRPAFQAKRRIVDRFIRLARPGSVLDLGANNGQFSLIPAGRKIYTISCDNDPLAINQCYLQNSANVHLLPLVIDLTNPSPGLGWAHTERSSFTDRFQTDLVMALALVHHLAISNNLPFSLIASWFSCLAPGLIIEFIPKDDSKVQILLQNRQDIFPDYTRENFEAAFRRYYTIREQVPVTDSRRIMYLMKRK